MQPKNAVRVIVSISLFAIGWFSIGKPTALTESTADIEANRDTPNDLHHPILRTTSGDCDENLLPTECHWAETRTFASVTLLDFEASTLRDLQGVADVDWGQASICGFVSPGLSMRVRLEEVLKGDLLGASAGSTLAIEVSASTARRLFPSPSFDTTTNSLRWHGGEPSWTGDSFVVPLVVKGDVIFAPEGLFYSLHSNGESLSTNTDFEVGSCSPRRLHPDSINHLRTLLASCSGAAGPISPVPDLIAGSLCHPVPTLPAEQGSCGENSDCDFRLQEVCIDNRCVVSQIYSDGSAIEDDAPSAASDSPSGVDVPVDPIPEEIYAQ